MNIRTQKTDSDNRFAKYKRCLLLSLFILLNLTGCGAENIQAPNTTEQDLKEYVFDSVEAVESISDEDLLYIAQNNYGTSDFIQDIDYGEVDLFNIPLIEQELNGNIYKEDVLTHILLYDLPLGEVDVNESISENEMQKYIDDFCKDWIAENNAWHDDTGCKTREEEIIYCGENDSYMEYSIRYTVLQTMYVDNELVTNVIPYAYRVCFLKDVFSVLSGKYAGKVYFGEWTLDRVKSVGDLEISLDRNLSLYREVKETDEAYVYTNYFVEIIGGDYGIDDTAQLCRRDWKYDKSSHVISYDETMIQGVDIPSTGCDGYPLVG